MGQNFLVSESVLKKIIAASRISKEDTVLEVGPGLGILTVELARCAKKVIAVEKDAALARVLQKNLAAAGIKIVSVVTKDILRVEAEDLTHEPYIVVANLPYYLTSRFLKKFLSEETHRPERLILMVQKEVALRIVARPPEMNLLALSVQLFGEPKIVAIVPREAFSPKPKVESAILAIENVSDNFFKEHAIDQKLFFAVARKAFQQKRKTLLHSLASFWGGREEAEKVFSAAGIKPGARPQELSTDDWARIVRSAPH